MHGKKKKYIFYLYLIWPHPPIQCRFRGLL